MAARMVFAFMKPITKNDVSLFFLLVQTCRFFYRTLMFYVDKLC